MDIIIIGAGGQAKVVVDIIEKQGIYRIIGFVDDVIDKGSTVYGYPIIGGMEIFGHNEFAAINAGIVAIGDNWARKQLVDKILQIRTEFVFINALHPSSIVARGVEIGRGIACMAGSIINSNARIGDHCIINTNSSVDHDTILEEFVSIGPGAIIGGEVKIGDCSAVALGASIIHRRNVGAHTIIGAGAVVIHDIESGVIAHGTPAKVTRTREIGEKYL